MTAAVEKNREADDRGTPEIGDGVERGGDLRGRQIERLRDLALGGRLRQPLLGQLDDL